MNQYIVQTHWGKAGELSQDVTAITPPVDSREEAEAMCVLNERLKRGEDWHQISIVRSWMVQIGEDGLVHLIHGANMWASPGGKEEKAVSALSDIQKELRGDAEWLHVKADELIIQYLRESGSARLADEYEKASHGFWYA